MAFASLLRIISFRKFSRSRSTKRDANKVKCFMSTWVERVAREFVFTWQIFDCLKLCNLTFRRMFSLSSLLLVLGASHMTESFGQQSWKLSSNDFRITFQR